MSYTEKLTNRQQENLDVRIFSIASKFGTRNLETMQWTFDNHQLFMMASALLDSEEKRIVQANSEQRDPTSGETLLGPVVQAKEAMLQRGIPYAQFKDMFPKFLSAYDAVPVMTPKEEGALGDRGAFDAWMNAPLKQGDYTTSDFVEGEPRYTAFEGTDEDFLLALWKAARASASQDWQTGVPPTKEDDSDFYIVAVRRANNSEKVFVFCAAYANNYSNEMRDRDGNEFVANGWFDVTDDPSGEFSELFTPILEAGDEVVGWQPLPKYCP